MPRWQTYEVNASDELDMTEKTSQVKFEFDQEMAGDSPNLASARYARRSASPVSSASTAGVSSSSSAGPSGAEEGMMKRKEVVTITSPAGPANKYTNDPGQSGRTTAICGWVCACILGTVALTFVLVIYLLPTEGIFPVRVQLYQKPDRPNVRQGSLQIYPGLNSSRYEHTISLDLADASINSEEILDVVKRYPVHDANELPPPPYIHCWFNNPTRDEPCFFHEGWLGELCSANDSYGYDTTSPYINPCFLIRIEGTGDWAPEPLRPEYVSDSWKHEYDPTFVGVGCRPKEGDKSGVTFERRPVKGFSMNYFPVNNFSPDLYLPPAVMVQVKGVPRNMNVTIECWIRTHNKHLLTDNGNLIINFVHKRTGSLLPAHEFIPASNPTTTVVNLPRLVQATHQTSSINTIPTTTTSLSTSSLPTVDNDNSTANVSITVADNSDGSDSDYTYEDDGGFMHPN